MTPGLSFIGTDPLYERRGAASLLVQWGIEQCKRDKAPAYLESTLEAGPLYEKHGFVAVEKLSLEIEVIEDDDGPEIYEEIGFALKP
jgi:GNAT superfamily N-acetyltransferase